MFGNILSLFLGGLLSTVCFSDGIEATGGPVISSHRVSISSRKSYDCFCIA